MSILIFCEGSFNPFGVKLVFLSVFYLIPEFFVVSITPSKSSYFFLKNYTIYIKISNVKQITSLLYSVFQEKQIKKKQLSY